MSRPTRTFHVYIMTNVSGTLYTGVTNNIERRVYEPQNHVTAGFTAKYRISKLLYYEEHDSASTAIAREKQIKGWRRRRKIELIESVNPNWKDLAADWFSADDTAK
jgi:putative endonuclease